MEELEARIRVLEAKINAMSDYSTRTVEQDNAVVGRGFARGTGTLGTYPHTTYGGAGTYDVPSQPSGTVTMIINGTSYKIPYQ